ncbi:hypothetical protein BHQ21_07860 [Mycobacterium sherrisii]|uniref:DUF202 domain-containing protein n=1 Tax=Mycobacterium sherrisii TaxID=243061 RepID=A0A1E3T0P0_9MYCO|nr:DUF202 domain-containing protein [Mycobacterium sherrisii]ODR07965.1 hypothetical protein BHQ21_07860 [Mycobacterium sherrisii]
MTQQQLIDVGAQAERTALAWQRTAIGGVAVAALVLRWDALDQLPMWPGIVLAVAAGATVVSLASRRYRCMLHAMADRRTTVSRRMVPAATVAMAVVILGVGAELAAADLG